MTEQHRFWPGGARPAVRVSMQFEMDGEPITAAALKGYGPSVAVAEEYSAGPLGAGACAAVPIVDPCTGRTLGIVELTSEVNAAGALMLPFVRWVAREVQHRLPTGSLVGEWVLRQQFLRAKRSAKGALVSLSQDSMMTNRAAAAILHPSDHALLWDWVTRGLRGDHQGPELSLVNGTSVEVSMEPVNDGTEVVGALIRLNPSPRADVIGPARPRRDRNAPRFGWASLTETEQDVAELVADGLTNIQAGTRLIMSRHTVGYHLRSIYRKLGIRSRVHLARLVTERALAPN
jgi:DNA-binding CsgD family transcriptional regulator